MTELTPSSERPRSQETADDRLQELRGEIDQIDDDLIGLLAKRMAVAVEIKKVKQETGMATFDPGREEKLKAKVAEMAAKDGLSEEFALQLFDRILVESKRVQDNL